MTILLDHRRIARSIALQVLYELDNSTHEAQSILNSFANIPAAEGSVRLLAYSVLCAFYYSDESDVADDDPIITQNLSNLPELDYKMLRRLVMGVVEQRDSLDKMIAHHAPEWPPDQIAIIDRNILRLAIFELLHEQLPIKVVINEAVEVAKIFGTESTPRFVNGVLGSVAEKHTHIVSDLDTENPIEPSH